MDTSTSQGQRAGSLGAEPRPLQCDRLVRRGRALAVHHAPPHPPHQDADASGEAIKTQTLVVRLSRRRR